MTPRLFSGIRVKKGLKAISFHAGLGVGLLAIGTYMAIGGRHWFAAGLLLLATIWIGSIPFRLQRTQ